MQVLVLSVRFGFSKPVEIAQRHREYYRKLSPVFFGDSLPPEFTLSGTRTLPIVSERSLSAESVMQLLQQALDHRTPDHLLIDLGGPDEKDVTRPNVLLGTLETLRALRSSCPSIKIGLLLPHAISEKDILFPTLKDVAEDTSVRVLTGDGTAWGAFYRTRSVPSEVITKFTAEARVDPLDKLQNRLIRRIGQYRLRENGNIIRHLYDGRLGHSELYELLTIWLADRVREGTRTVAYDAMHSAWFRAPVEAALRDTGLADSAIAIETAKDASRADAILLPIVRTGTSLRELLKHWRPSRGAAAQPKIWTALSTAGQFRTGQQRIPVDEASEDGPTVNFEYALKVVADSGPIDMKFWEDSGLAPIFPDDEDLGSLLPADAMWGMIFEAGLIEEQNVPPRRKSVGYVPAFGVLVDLNSTYIASKIDQLLQQRFPGTLPPSISFLCPKEDNAAALADSLRELSGHDTIHVDRALIEAYLERDSNALADDLADPDETFKKLEGWRQLVRRVSGIEKPSLVLLDEFHFSGGTMQGLFNLASAFELPVLCSVSIAQFGPQTSVLPVPQIALYDFGRPS